MDGWLFQKRKPRSMYACFELDPQAQQASTDHLLWILYIFGTVRFSSNPYFLACFFSPNSVFLSQQISRNSVSTCFFSEANGTDEHEPGKWHAEAERPLSQPHRPKLSIFLFYYRTSEADLWRCSMRNALKGRYRLSKLQKDVDIISRFGDLCISGDGLLWKVWFFFVLFFIVLRDSDLRVVLVQVCARLAVAMQPCR